MCNSNMMRFLLICILVITNTAYSQSACSIAELIDKTYFLQHEQPSSFFDTLNLPRKTSHTLKFNFAGKPITFKDDLSDRNYVEYFFAGNDRKRNWLLIKKQDYNQEYFYLFQSTSKNIDTLVGQPFIYGNKIICLEGSYTDSPRYIEVWDIKKDKLVRIANFSLSRECAIYPTRITLSDKMEIMFVDIDNRYWKTKPL